jgi:hypothetical protein
LCTFRKNIKIYHLGNWWNFFYIIVIMTNEGIPNIACIFQVVSQKKIFKYPTLTPFHFFYIFFFFVANLHTCLKFGFYNIWKTFLQEYILKFAIHNAIKKLWVSEIGRNWNKQKFHFWLILKTQKFLIKLCIVIMTIYSCRNIFRYCKYKIWDLYEDLRQSFNFLKMQKNRNYLEYAINI